MFVNLPVGTPANLVNARIADLLSKRLPASLLGAITIVESRRALSRTVRKRP